MLLDLHTLTPWCHLPDILLCTSGCLVNSYSFIKLPVHYLLREAPLTRSTPFIHRSVCNNPYHTILGQLGMAKRSPEA